MALGILEKVPILSKKYVLGLVVRSNQKAQRSRHYLLYKARKFNSSSYPAESSRG